MSVDPEFDLAAFLQPFTADHIDPSWIEERADLARRVVASLPLPEFAADALAREDVATQKIITAARYMLALTDDERLPELNRRVIGCAASDTLPALADALARGGESNLITTVVLLLDELLDE